MWRRECRMRRTSAAPRELFLLCMSVQRYLKCLTRYLKCKAELAPVAPHQIVHPRLAVARPAQHNHRVASRTPAHGRHNQCGLLYSRCGSDASLLLRRCAVPKRASALHTLERRHAAARSDRICRAGASATRSPTGQRSCHHTQPCPKARCPWRVHGSCPTVPRPALRSEPVVTGTTRATQHSAVQPVS